MRPPQQKPVIARREYRRRGPWPTLRRHRGRHDLGVRHFGDDVVEDVLDAADLARIALARKQFRGDGQVAEFGQPPADIGDMFVDAEDLGNHQDHRKIGAFVGLRTIGDHFAVADGNLDFSRNQAVGAGLDNGLGHDRLGGEGETRAQHGNDESTTGEGGVGNQAVEFGVAGSGRCLAHLVGSNVGKHGEVYRQSTGADVQSRWVISPDIAVSPQYRSIFCLGKGVLFRGDDRPGFCQFCIDCKKLLLSRRQVRLGKYRFSRALRHAHVAVDAFIRIDCQKVRPLVKAFHRADNRTVGYLQRMQFSVTT